MIASTIKEELGVLFVDGQCSYLMQTNLEEISHPQPATPIVTKKSFAIVIVIDEAKQQRF